MPKVTVQLPGQKEPTTLDARVEGDQFELAIGEKQLSGKLTVVAPGEGWLTIEGRKIPFYALTQGETLSLWVEGKTYHLPLIKTGARRSGGGAAGALSDGAVKAPMPGTVLKVPVKVGDAVEANQPLVIMESMKMEMTLSAPHTATVKAIRCAEGQLVEMGAMLIELEQA